MVSYHGDGGRGLPGQREHHWGHDQYESPVDGVGDPSHLVGMFAASETSDSTTSDTTISVGTTSDGTYDYSR